MKNTFLLFSFYIYSKTLSKFLECIFPTILIYIQNSNTLNAEAFLALWCANRTSKCFLQERPLIGLLCVSSSPQACCKLAAMVFQSFEDFGRTATTSLRRSKSCRAWHLNIGVKKYKMQLHLFISLATSVSAFVLSFICLAQYKHE